MKRTKLALFILLAMVVSLSGCMNSGKNEDEEKIAENETQIQEFLKKDSLGSSALRDSSGMYYIIRKANPNGQKAKTGDGATVRINGYLLNGSKVLSIEKDSTYTFPVEGYWTQIYGLERGIRLMRTGEKATFLIPFYLAFGNVEQVNIPAYSVIRLEVEFIKTRTEVQQIDDFLAKKQFQISERTSDNLVIIRTNTVTGDTLGVGKSVSVKYVGKLLNEVKFQESTIPFTTGTNGAVAGFDRAVRKLRKTEKAIIIFPSALGYKERGSGPIPPYTPIMFEVEVLP
jgi:FKBP-type peptidyl-prolyl cis-trans isomerase